MGIIKVFTVLCIGLLEDQIQDVYVSWSFSSFGHLELGWSLVAWSILTGDSGIVIIDYNGSLHDFWFFYWVKLKTFRSLINCLGFCSFMTTQMQVGSNTKRLFECLDKSNLWTKIKIWFWVAFGSWLRVWTNHYRHGFIGIVF